MSNRIKINALYILFPVIGIVYCSSGSAQNLDYKELLPKIRKAFIEKVTLNASLTVTAYKNKNDYRGQVVGSGIILKDAKFYYSKYQKNEFVSNNHCSVSINHSSKTINYIDRKGTSIQQPTMDIDLDGILGNDSLSLTYSGNDLIKIKVIRFGQVVSHTIFVDSKSLLVKKILYNYPESTTENSFEFAKIKVEYSYSDSKPDRNLFSEKRFVESTGKGVKAAKEYAEYKLNAM